MSGEKSEMTGIEDLDALCFSLIAKNLSSKDIYSILCVSSSFGKRFVDSVHVMKVDALDARLKYFKSLERLFVHGSVDFGSLSTLIDHLPHLNTLVADRLVLCENVPIIRVAGGKCAFRVVLCLRSVFVHSINNAQTRQ